MTSTKRPMWTDVWELSSDMVNCKECHAGQYPYIELLEVLKMVHYADEPLPKDAPEAWSPPKG